MSRLNGTDRSRTPVASNTAFEIADGHHRRRRLARAPRLFRWPVDQVDDDLGHLREGQDRIARPIEAGHHAAVEGHLLLQRAADGLDDVAFDLALTPSGLMICPQSCTT